MKAILYYGNVTVPRQPLAEVFGFPVQNLSDEASRYQSLRLCPYHNKVPNCTKDKAQSPLGVCSIFDGEKVAITCPIRFREDWLIAEDAASFFFPPSTTWTSLPEVRLGDADGESAGNIDLVLVAYDAQGKVTDFGALEVQAVYISGNVRKPFERFLEEPDLYRTQGYGAKDYPRADYLSSSRKRLAPQLIYKGGILHEWGKKSAVALHMAFFNTLPPLPEVPLEQAEIAWLLYDLVFDEVVRRYRLKRHRTVYTRFDEALETITRTRAGELSAFVERLQEKLDAKLELAAPITPLLGEEGEAL